MKTKSKLENWAWEKCNSWNWNCNVAEIAKELIDEGVHVGGLRFGVLEKEFVRYFPDNGKRDIETIRYIMEVFGG